MHLVTLFLQAHIFICQSESSVFNERFPSCSFKFHYNPEEELESLDQIPKERMVTSPLLIKFLSSPHRRHLTYNDWQLIQSLGFVVWPTNDNELAYVNTETLADVLETITADPVERTTTPRPHADPVQTFDAKMSNTEHTPTYTGSISSYRDHIPHLTQAIPFSTDPLVDDDNMILIGANNLPTFLNYNLASHQDSGHIAKPSFNKVYPVPEEDYHKYPNANGIPSVTEKMPTITNPIPPYIQHIPHIDDSVSQTTDPVPQNVIPLHINPLPADHNPVLDTVTSLDFVPFESQRHTFEGREEKDHYVNSVDNILAGNLDNETGATATDKELDNSHTPISDGSKNGAETGGEDYTTVASEPNDTSTVDEDNNALGEHKIFTKK
jgi:hypothetical protein